MVKKMSREVQKWESFFFKFYWIFLHGAPSKNRCKKVFQKLDLSKNARIIEMGCGTGFFLRWFKKQGFANLWGLDFSQKVLDKLKGTGIKTVKADARKTGLRSNYFDLVFSDGVVEHFSNPEPFLKEFTRIAKDYLVTIVPRPTLHNRLEAFILRPPKEYNRPDEEWVKLHQKLGFKDIRSFILGGNCLMIICRKSKAVNL